MQIYRGIKFLSWSMLARQLLGETHLDQVRFGLVGVVGLMAVTQSWVSPHRPYPANFMGAVNFRVTNSGDHGPGSLREALLYADRAGGHARVEILVAKVVPTAPLPPFINPNGIDVMGAAGRTVIDASKIVTGAVFDIRSKGTAIRLIEIANAQEAIMAGSIGLRVASSKFTNCKTAIELIDGGGDLVLEDSIFDQNGIGLRADTYERNITVQRCKFLSHSQAGIWAVSQKAHPSAQDLDISRSQFNDNRFGIVTANHKVRIHDNELAMSHEAAVQLFDSGSSVEHNRIEDGLAAGIQAESTEGVLIADNEIFRNKTVGVIVKNSSAALIRRNSIYSNGEGIVFVNGHGSPNTASQNGIFSQSGDAIVSIGDEPILKNNVIRSNHSPGPPNAAVPGSGGEKTERTR